MSSRYDIKIDQGSTFRFNFVYNNSENEPIDFSGLTVEMQVRRSTSDDKLVCQLNENWPSGCFNAGLSGEFVKGEGVTGYTGGIITNYNGETGNVFIEIDSETTYSFEEPRLFYDIEFSQSDGSVTKLLKGCINISRTIQKVEREAPFFLGSPSLTGESG